MTSIFLIVCGEAHGGYTVVGAFSSRELAEAAVTRTLQEFLIDPLVDFLDILEMPIDA